MRTLLAIFIAAFMVVLVIFPLWAWFLAAIVLAGWFLAACVCRVSSIREAQWEEVKKNARQ